MRPESDLGFLGDAPLDTIALTNAVIRLLRFSEVDVVVRRVLNAIFVLEGFGYTVLSASLYVVLRCRMSDGRAKIP